jgi:hypothetical protein
VLLRREEDWIFVMDPLFETLLRSSNTQYYTTGRNGEEDARQKNRSRDIIDFKMLRRSAFPSIIILNFSPFEFIRGNNDLLNPNLTILAPAKNTHTATRMLRGPKIL